MDVVLRPVNGQFLEEVAFPAFELGIAQAAVGLEQLHSQVADPQTRILLEQLRDSAVDGSFYSLDSGTWLETVYRLLFCVWTPKPNGWLVSGDAAGYGGPLDELLHLALMLEDTSYPYADDRQAARAREVFLERPRIGRGLASLLAGAWDPFPDFAPDQVLNSLGRGYFNTQERFAFAEWAYRSRQIVGGWAKDLPRKLRLLLDKESTRLRPVEVPEAEEVLAYWLGRTREPPTLCVLFSGLGTQAASWVQTIGALAGEIRNATSAGHALTALITPGAERAAIK